MIKRIKSITISGKCLIRHIICGARRYYGRKRGPLTSLLKFFFHLIVSLSDKIALFLDRLSITRYGKIPIPPQHMRNKVRKGAVLAKDFVFEGRQVYNELLDLFSKNGLDLQKSLKVYEFGCGCGRIARHFIEYPSIEYSGSDVDDELIKWCRVNLKSYSFAVNAYNPPLIYPDNFFDLVYSISVFTHLPAATQQLWFKELHRVVKGEGSVVVSIIEKDTSELSTGIAVKERIDDDIQRDWLGKSNNPDVYYTTYHTVDYIRSQLAGLYEIIEVREKSIRGKQSLILLKPIGKAPLQEF